MKKMMLYGGGAFLYSVFLIGVSVGLASCSSTEVEMPAPEPCTELYPYEAPMPQNMEDVLLWHEWR